MFAHLTFPVPYSKALSCPNFLLVELEFGAIFTIKMLTVNVVSFYLGEKLLPFSFVLFF